METVNNDIIFVKGEVATHPTITKIVWSGFLEIPVEQTYVSENVKGLMVISMF